MLKIAPKLRSIRGFGEEVKLIENDHLIISNDLLRMQSATQSGTASQQSGQLFQQSDVGPHGFFDTRSYEFDHHVLAAEQPRTVHLGDGCGCQRLLVQPTENL